MMKKLLVIDGKALSYKAFASGKYSGAVTVTGHKVPMLAHFIAYILELMGKYEPTGLVVVFGQPVEGSAVETDPSYKVQFALLKVLMKSLDIEAVFSDKPVLGLVRAIAEAADDKEYKVYVSTSDEKGLQLINKKIHVVLFGKGRDIHYNPNKFYLEYGIEAGFYPDYFALIGNGHEEVPGVPGIGEKTAIRVLQEYGSVPHILENLNVVTDHRLRELLDLYQEEIAQGFAYEKLGLEEMEEISFEKMAFAGFGLNAHHIFEHFGLNGLFNAASEEAPDLPLFEFME